MQKADLRILIVDDDKTFGKAVETALSREGYSVVLCSDSASAKKHFKHSIFSLVISDCMLPLQSGVDLAQDLRNDYGDEFKLILMSGIFRDKLFIREAKAKTGAAEFFTKPFEIEKLLDAVKNIFSDQIGEDRGPLTAMLFSETVSTEQVERLLGQIDKIHAFQLPQLYNLISKSGLTGHLNLIYSDGAVSSIGFHLGSVDQVNVTDSNSYFGILLVENGFCNAEDVKVGLASDSKLRIGERLVHTNTLSPHAIYVVQTEQMGIRLSKTIRDCTVEVVFIKRKEDTGEFKIDSSQLSIIMHDWVSSKISLKWLKTAYVPLIDQSVEKSSNFGMLKSLKHLPLMRQMADKLEMLSKNESIRDLMDAVDEDAEDHFLQLIHFLLINQVVRLNETNKQKSVDFSRQIKRFKSLLADQDNKTHFDILGVSDDARFQDIQKAYHELAKVTHPDRLQPNAPKELRDLAQQVFSRISQAHEVLRDKGLRERYLNELEFGDADSTIAAENLFEQGLTLLQKRNYRQALDTFIQVKTHRGHRDNIDLYLTWAEIKLGPQEHNKNNFLQGLYMRLNQVPPEDRHSHVYFFVRGLYFMTAKNYERAERLFKNALALNPGFFEAKKELSRVERKIEALNKNSGLTAIVHGLFTNTKKNRRSS